MNDLINILFNINSKSEMRNFLLGLFTVREMEELTKRLKIIRMLKKGNTQKYIAQKLQVGIATVTRGSKEIQKGKFKNYV